MNNTSVDRRGLLASAVAGLAAGVLPGASGAASHTERLSVGIVGFGMRGRYLVDEVLSLRESHSADVTAVCDIWSHNRDRGVDHVRKKARRQPRAFRSYEEMLAWDGLDAVLIATPDHAHAQHLTMALRAKKHAYCEKPFANVLEEARTAVEVWRKSDRVATVGTQMRSDPRHIAAAAAVRAGSIGPVVKVERFFSAYSPYRWRRLDEVKRVKEKDTDWKAWLMGKPDRPFDPRLYLEFRLYPEFSSGIIDQWMSHGIDAVHMITGAKVPRGVVALGGTYAWKDGRENPDTVHVLLDYPEGFLCSYSTSLANEFGTGGWVLGRKGTLEYVTNWRVSGEGVPGSTVKAYPLKYPAGYKSEGNAGLHLANWLECVRKGRRETNCTPEHGYWGAVACMMAARALRSGRRITFDDKSQTLSEA